MSKSTTDIHFSETTFYPKNEIVKEIITTTVRMRLLSNNIIHYTYANNSDVGVTEHIENHNALIEIAKIHKHPILIDVTEYTNVSSEARSLIRSLEPISPTLARAVVTDSLAMKMIATFYKNINKSMYPFQVFKKYDKAQNWLLNFLK